MEVIFKILIILLLGPVLLGVVITTGALVAYYIAKKRNFENPEFWIIGGGAIGFFIYYTYGDIIWNLFR